MVSWSQKPPIYNQAFDKNKSHHVKPDNEEIEILGYCLMLIIWIISRNYTWLEKCPYLEFFWSVFFRIQIEYGEILCISPYSNRMRENMNQKTWTGSSVPEFCPKLPASLILPYLQSFKTLIDTNLVWVSGKKPSQEKS